MKLNLKNKQQKSLAILGT